jgi:hypothetical protein
MEEKKALPPTPLDTLSPELRARLDGLQTEVRFEKLTTSFSIEERTAGGKRGTFYSVTASRGHGAEVNQFHEDAPSASYSPEEAKIVRCLLAKHVVGATYDDASKRGILPKKQVLEEAKAILLAYDEAIVRILRGDGK